MIYNKFQNLELSALGFGTMRMPQKDEVYAHVDEEEVEKMIAYAMASGVNYYDTAWGYHDGEAENVAGRVLSRYPRESYYLATKFPGYDLNNMGKVEEIFEEQLRKCKTEYFDFYLFHNVCEMNIEGYLNPEYKTYEYLIEQKRNGRIKHLGFSAHGEIPIIERFLAAYGKDMEFGQLQINWLDWDFQGAKDKVALLKKHNIPVWVMEPVRGGKLAALPEEYSARLRALRPEATNAEWAFRFLQSLPEVVVTLSGMSNMEQVKENIATYAEFKPLKESEKEVLADIAEEMTSKKSLPCTACRYCTSHCPMGIDIPDMIRLYNEHNFTGGGFLAPMALMAVPEGKRPADCIGCRSCEAVCPQRIKISEMMAEFASKL